MFIPQKRRFAYYVMSNRLKGEYGMYDFQIGDIVARRSYGYDIAFRISDVLDGGRGKTHYVLRGLLYRIIADAPQHDLVKQDPNMVLMSVRRNIAMATRRPLRARMYRRISVPVRVTEKPGRILHIDSSKEYLDMCMDYYRNAGLEATGKLVPESEQPSAVRRLLQQSRPDILVLTGHDAFKKGANADSVEGYRNSKHYIQAVKEARRYESSHDRLCIFAGACQSYYEGIMNAGANFASSPGRILIHSLDPAIVSDKVAYTEVSRMVTPAEVAGLTVSGKKGIWGIDTKGRLVRE